MLGPHLDMILLLVVLGLAWLLVLGLVVRWGDGSWLTRAEPPAEEAPASPDPDDAPPELDEPMAVVILTTHHSERSGHPRD